MENRLNVKKKTNKYDESESDKFILDLVDLNDTLDLKKSNDRE